MFGRRRKQEEAAAEAVREADRRALFAQLASRPENVCPFLGLADDRVGYEDTPGDAHRCYAFGDPAPLSTEQQSKVCLDRGYGNCPRYLRGVLVIPTEELEALRRPQPMRAPPPAEPQPEARRRRRIPLAWAGVLVLLLLIGAGVGYLVTRPAPGVAIGSSTPTASAATSPSASGTPAPSATPTVSDVPTPTVEPTPAPGDTFDHYEVSVPPGSFTIYQLDGQGNVVQAKGAIFDDYSFAGVAQVTSPVRSWLIETGDYIGYSYIVDRSGPFRIREVYLSANGERRVAYVPDDQR